MKNSASPPGEVSLAFVATSSPPAQKPVAPSLVVFSSLFPSAEQPLAGQFVRERMFRVGEMLRITVVCPVPWFPMQGFVRRWRPHFRPMPAAHERQRRFDVWFPRFLSFPGVFRRWDGALMAWGVLRRMRKLQRDGCLDIIDAHFGYPDGYAAVLLGRWLGVPVSITLRGTETKHAQDPVIRPLLRKALERASAIVAGG